MIEAAQSTQPRPAAIVSEIAGDDAAAVFEALAAALALELPGDCASELEHGFRTRESLGSTALGGGVALPHCRFDQVDEPMVVVARHPSGIPFGAPDEVPVRLFIGIATPSAAPGAHLGLLAALARRLRDRERVLRMLAAPDDSTLLAELFPRREGTRP